ncbi:MAG: replication protein [Chloroflexota bacterium]|nr:replication protein [Chloroflexota bacterium]
MSKDYRFNGFASPNFTQVPDELFDVLAPELTEAELRVLLYIIRRTFGFKKQADAISVSQLVGGLKSRDGRLLDKGTGMSRSAVWRGATGLVEKGVLAVQRTRSEEGDYESNVYSLRFREGVALQKSNPRSPKEQPVTLQESRQETDGQTDGQTEHFEISKDHAPKIDPARAEIVDYLADFAREFGDQAPLTSSVTRTLKLFRESGLALPTFIDVLYAARATTKERSAGIKAAPVGNGPWPVKPKMAYFFAVLEDLVGRTTDGPRDGTNEQTG